MTDILNALTELFKTVFEAYLKSPLAFMVVIIALFCAYIVVDSNSILNQALTPVSIEQERFKKVVMLNDEIPNRMEKLRVDLGADRVLVRQFHNGKQGISGIPFTFVQTTYAATAPGKGLVDEAAWMSYPVATMSNTLSRMFDSSKGYAPHCIFISKDDIKDDIYRALFIRYSIVNMIKCPLVDKDGNVVGTLVSGWTVPMSADQEKNVLKYETMMNNEGRIIVARLGEIGVDSTPWWKFWA